MQMSPNLNRASYWLIPSCKSKEYQMAVCMLLGIALTSKKAHWHALPKLLNGKEDTLLNVFHNQRILRTVYSHFPGRKWACWRTLEITKPWLNLKVPSYADLWLGYYGDQLISRCLEALDFDYKFLLIGWGPLYLEEIPRNFRGPRVIHIMIFNILFMFSFISFSVFFQVFVLLSSHHLLSPLLSCVHNV